MKKFVIAMMLFSPVVYAEQLTITIAVVGQPGTAVNLTANDKQTLKLTREMNEANGRTCLSLALPKTCTDAQAKAIQPNAVIYSNVQTWLRSFISDKVKMQVQLNDEARRAQLGNAYDAASDAVKAQVESELGIQ